MTPTEFKAWFEGFTEAMDGMPSEAQWAKVKERVAHIDGTPTTYPVYVERYWPRRQPWWDYGPAWVSGVASYSSSNLPTTTLSCVGSADDRLGKLSFEQPAAFDSSHVLYAAGKADFYDLIS